jgi:hypothetical protein
MGPSLICCYSYLASFGALITIFLLAIDPFFQQIIMYNSCMQVDSNTALLPRGNNYTGDGTATRPGNAILSPQTAAAIQLGVMDKLASARELITFQCSSGNCTFPTTPDGAAFSTVGMCYAVEDISNTIYLNRTDNNTWQIPTTDTAYQPKVGWTNISSVNPYGMLYTRKWSKPSTEFDDLLTFDILMLNLDDPDTCDLEPTVNCTKHPWAVRGSIIPCIKTYTSTINSSKLVETELSTTFLKKSNASAIEVTTSTNLTWSLATDTVLRDGRVQQCETSDTPSDRTPIGISANGTLALTPVDIVKYYEADCVWVVDYTEALALNQFVSYMHDVEWLVSAYDSTVATTGDDWLNNFYMNGTANISTAANYMASLSGTIETMMRQHGPVSGWLHGDVLTVQTCIGVQWSWLALPTILILFVIGFLALVISACVATGTWKGAWRSSALAAFFHGMDGDSRQAVEHVRGKSTMEEVAKRVYVKMVDEHSSLKIDLN